MRRVYGEGEDEADRDDDDADEESHAPCLPGAANSNRAHRRLPSNEGLKLTGSQE
jgi:hypothetical protein